MKYPLLTPENLRRAFRIQGFLLELAAGDEAEAGEILFRLTNNPGKGYAGVRDAAQLTQPGNLSAALRAKRDQ